MEKFKAKIKRRTLIISIVLIIMAATYFLFSLYRNTLPPVPDFIRGFHTGAFIGVELVAVFFIARYSVSLRKEELLKKLYIEENDERTKMIMQKSGALGMGICMAGLALGTIAAGFMDKTVFFSLLGALLFISLVRGFIKVYYHFTM